MSANSIDKPLHFRPIYKTMIWGGERIAPYKATAGHGSNVGESWELSQIEGSESVLDDGSMSITELIARHGAELLGTKVAERFGMKMPLLIKLIDARDDLSVQVHPGDDLARERHGCSGKTEMWYVVKADEGGMIHCGLSRPMTPGEFDTHCSNSSIMDVISHHHAHEGQIYFVPSGTLHAIGAGLLLAEIQQTCDITYRIYDYDRLDANGRPRQLHIDQARDAIDYSFPPLAQRVRDCISHTERAVVDSAYFTVDVAKTDAADRYDYHGDGSSFAIIIAVDGDVNIEMADGSKDVCRGGHTVLMPASVRDFTLASRTAATALVVYIR